MSSLSSKLSGSNSGIPYFTNVIPSGNIFHASRTHSIMHFCKRGGLYREECLFAILLEQGHLERGAFSVYIIQTQIIDEVWCALRGIWCIVCVCVGKTFNTYSIFT